MGQTVRPPHPASPGAARAGEWSHWWGSWGMGATPAAQMPENVLLEVPVQHQPLYRWEPKARGEKGPAQDQPHCRTQPEQGWDPGILTCLSILSLAPGGSLSAPLLSSLPGNSFIQSIKSQRLSA